MRRRKLFLLSTLIFICIVFSVVLLLLTDKSKSVSKTWPKSFQVKMLGGDETIFYPGSQRVVILSNDCNYCDSMVLHLIQSKKFLNDSNVVLFWIDKKGPGYFSSNMDPSIASKPNFLLADSIVNKLGISAYPAVIQLENGIEFVSVKGFNRILLRDQLGY
jgi:thiol-disulfide isomerase/thioredoxin